MKFTEEQIQILEQHKHHWIGLRDIQVMQNLDASVIGQLQGVYNAAVGPDRFTPWCPSCIAELVTKLYTQYERWEADGSQDAEVAQVQEGDKKNAKPGRKPKTVQNGN